MSSLVSDSGARGAAPFLVGGNSTGVLIFPSPVSPFNFGPLVGSPPYNTNQPTKPAVVTVKAGLAEGQQFTVKASGNVYLAAGTFKLLLYAGSSLTAANNVLVASSSALSLTASAYAPFAFSITGQGDHNSGDVQFYSSTFVIGGAPEPFAVSEFAGSPPVPGVALIGENLLANDIPFCVGVQFGTGNSANKAALQAFYLEQ
jgi:hypothetical protein